MATKSIAWNTGSGNITLTYQGQGDGPISVQSDANNLGNARSQVITVETVGGAIARNLTINQAACPFPVGDVKNFSYTGNYQEVELPAGQYKLQCWGAQGGSNAAASSYSITAKAGGKGGYSEGIITLSTKTTVRVYVGGQGSSSAGGYNGGGSTTGSSSYSTGTSGQAGYEFGISKMGGGGGATDIRLSDGALLSRMIVAGGGAGGAMCYKKATSSSTTTINKSSFPSTTWSMYMDGNNARWYENPENDWGSYIINVSAYRGCNCSFTVSTSTGWAFIKTYPTANYSLVDFAGGAAGWTQSDSCNTTIPSDATYLYINSGINKARVPSNLTITTTSTTTSNDYQVGGVGGGTQGGAYSSTYAGKQASAGSGGSFGLGANQTITNYRYCSGAGGGGWYGGGTTYSDSGTTSCKYGGGGSGWVNTSASSGNRPSGYTGPQLDSGTTYAGNTSFPSTSGGTETGHSGNGYAKITRLA